MLVVHSSKNGAARRHNCQACASCVPIPPRCRSAPHPKPLPAIADYCIPLEATGSGSTIVCSELAAGPLDFGAQLSGRPWAREVVISNMGRRGVSLAWTNARADELAKEFARTSKGSGERP